LERIYNKYQAEGLIVKRRAREYRIEASYPDFKNLPVVDKVKKASNAVDFDRLKKKDSMLSGIGRNEIMLQCNMYTGDAEFESIRDYNISRYRPQENLKSFGDKPAIEMKI